MTPELIIKSLINVASVTALVGDRMACESLPQNSSYPAVVYSVISDVPQYTLNVKGDAQYSRARIQINPIAATIPEVKAVHAAILAEINWTINKDTGENRILSCWLDSTGSISRDDELGLWTQSADYMLLYSL